MNFPIQFGWELWPLLVLVLVFIIFTIRSFVVYGKVAFHKLKPDDENQSLPAVSIVICAKNEGDNLTEFLPSVLTQNYPDYEVIVVNDCSWDNTEDVLREYGKEFPNLRTITVKEDDYYKHGKKFALMVGIKGAKNETLLLTDADCKVDSPDWIKHMVAAYQNQTEIVLGYGPYIKTKGFLNKLIRFDSFMIGLHYLSQGLRQQPFMGVGRNLSYKKELFFKHKGFSTHYHIASGDDDLFINTAATSKNTAVCLHPDSFTYSIPANSFTNWFRQKNRHLSTSPLFKPSTKFKIMMEFLPNYLFYLLFTFLLFFQSTLLIALGLLLLKYIVQLIIFNSSMKRLKEKDLLWLFPFLEISLLFLYPAFHLNKAFSKPNKWKT